jgi:hypothetical protein
MFVNWIVGGGCVSEATEVGGVEIDRSGDAIVSEFLCEKKLFMVEDFLQSLKTWRLLLSRGTGFHFWKAQHRHGNYRCNVFAYQRYRPSELLPVCRREGKC